MESNLNRLRKDIAKVLSDPSDANVAAVTMHFWYLPDGDEFQPLRFIVIAVHVLSKRGISIDEASIVEWLQNETYGMARPCKAELKSMANGNRQLN